MTISTEYSALEQVVAYCRTALPSGSKVFDHMPTITSQADLDNWLINTVESVRLCNFWTVQLQGIDPSGLATMTQREGAPMLLSGFMSRSDKPGAVQSDVARMDFDPFKSGTATSGSTTTLTDSGQSMTVNAYANSHELRVTYSDGTIEQRRILSNTATQFTVRQAFNTAISAGVTYAVYLRPTEWLIHEQARAIGDSLTDERSLGGRVVTSTLAAWKLENVILFERSLWRITSELKYSLVTGKSWA